MSAKKTKPSPALVDALIAHVKSFLALHSAYLQWSQLEAQRLTRLLEGKSQDNDFSVLREWCRLIEVQGQVIDTGIKLDDLLPVARPTTKRRANK